MKRLTLSSLFVLFLCISAYSQGEASGALTSDPFDPTSCLGEGAKLTDFIRFFEPGTTQTSIGKAELFVRERVWNKFTGVGPWQAAQVPDQHHVKIHTYNVGGSDYADTVRSISPTSTILTIKGDELNLIVSNFSYPWFDGVNHTGLSCTLGTENLPRCGTQYVYPAIVRTREGSEFTDVTAYPLRHPYDSGEPLVFEGLVTSTCLRFSAHHVDEEGGVEREFVILQAF